MTVSPRKASVLLLVLLVMALFVGACGPPPRPNNPPIANAGLDRAVPLGVPVQLSGSGSSDPEGKPLSYAWTFNQRPTGSLAALQNATSVQCSFTPDVAGGYVIRLTVSDGNASSVDTVTITAGSGGSPGNNAPVANAGVDQSVNVGQVVMLNGSGSTDADGDTLTYHWAWLTRPPGSTAVLNGLDTANPSFTPDQAGTYTVSLTVSDGQAIDTDDVTVNVSPSAGGGITTFAFTLVDAAYSRTLERLIMAEYHLSTTKTIVKDEFCLHIYDPATGIDQAVVTLEMRPNCLALSPDGRYAAVGHDGRISYIDLTSTPPTVRYLDQCPVNVAEIMLPGDGYVYAFPDLDTELVPFTIINLTTGVKSPEILIPKIVQAAPRPNAAGTAFAVDGEQLFEYLLGAGTITDAWFYIADGVLRYIPGDNLWFSSDGDRLITQTGKIYWWNPDLMYHGSLDLATGLVSLDHIIDASTQELYAIVPAFPENFEVVVYGYDFQTVKKIMGLPEVTYNNVTDQWPGKFVFFSAAGDVMYVLAVPLSNDVCAVITLATP